MKNTLSRFTAMLLVMMMLPAPASWATCGGGGGGGTGGMRSGSGSEEMVYHVPWRILKADEPPVKAGLMLYWLPVNDNELRNSSLRNSRMLTFFAQQCVTMGVVDAGTPLGQKLVPGVKLPIAMLAEPDGTVVGKVENNKGYLRVEEVEKLLEGEFKKRESALKEKFAGAKDKAKAGDNENAIVELRGVVEQKCMFPKLAKDAAKELKKLGVTDVGQIFDPPNFDRAVGARVDRAMRRGLRAEDNANYVEAERLYTEAHRMDPADPVPLRYLGELYRHHTGEWDKAYRTFEQILAMPADPLSRAIALHGIGKMTIHDGEFKKGLGLMEQSVEAFPTPLAYRNIAVYWNSEGDAAKTDFYTQKALELDPTDAYNVVFAAAFMAGSGRAEEALKIAVKNEKLLSASYNLAAIYAQTGQKEKALALLKRHFFEYERYAAVRSKEMMEARVDAVFASLRHDAAFLDLTKDADGKLQMPGMTGSPR